MKRHALYGILTGAVASHLARKLTAPERERESWKRRNYRGNEVTLAGGVATAGALVATSVPLSLLDAHQGGAHAVATACAGGLGYLDDDTSTRASGSSAKGFTGHLEALSRGEITTGAAKIAGIGVGSLLAAITIERGSERSSLVDVGINTALIAGTANLINLLDLRPGRALKTVCLLSALSCAGPPPVAAEAGAVLAIAGTGLPRDLDERDMLGDTGANPLGAALGTAWAHLPSRRLRTGLLAAIIALTAASEKISFSRVIESTPILSHLDHWGRRA